jgi:hypothetical protein
MLADAMILQFMHHVLKPKNMALDSTQALRSFASTKKHRYLRFAQGSVMLKGISPCVCRGSLLYQWNVFDGTQTRQCM